jgi:phage terminase large subunit-like protein
MAMQNHFDTSYIYKPTPLMLETSLYDERRADFVVNFIQMLKHTTGEFYGKQFYLLPWQETAIRNIFGIVNKDTGYRQFKTAYIEVPKKNGKSELAAAVALYLLMGDGEKGAEIYSAAADINQASIVFNTAKSFLEQSPDLHKITKILPSTKRITFPYTNSLYRVLSAENTKAKYGLNLSGLIFDELCSQPTRELYDTLTKFSGDARSQSLNFIISTSGREKTSIWYEVHSKALDILEGRKTDPTFYPLVYAIREDESWEDPEVWKRCNPSLGVTIKMETVQASFEQALQNPADEMLFRQFRLNELTNADIRWMPMGKWDKCGEDIDFTQYEGKPCYCGLDLSSTTDLTALVLVFPPLTGDDKFTVMPFFWLPEATIDLRTRRDHVPYRVWKKQGVFNTTEGETVDYSYISAFINKLAEKYKIVEIAMDKWNSEGIRHSLEEIGAEYGFEVFPFGQGYQSLSAPTKDLMRFTLEGKIRHGKHPVLDWCISNAIAEIDAAENIKLSKKKSTERIDGAIATIMALARAEMHTDNNNSVYEQRGILWI